MNALDDIFSLLHVQSSVFCRAELSAPWAVFTRGADCAIFHVVVRGAGWILLDEGPPRSFRSGDLLVLPHGHPHVLADAPTTPAVPIRTLPAEPSADGLPCVIHGGEGPQTSILCGLFRLGPEGREALVRQLPPLIHAEGGSGATATWLDATLHLLGEEARSPRPGSEVVVQRLADVLFVQVLRAWAARHGEHTPGWLAALSEPGLARALGALHHAPAQSWTAAALARQAGMSRSAFYARFTEVVGQTPSSYVTELRMLLARDLLRGRGASVAEVASSVGYASEAAFSRAFKRTVGESPARWRRSLQAPGAYSGAEFPG